MKGDVMGGTNAIAHGTDVGCVPNEVRSFLADYFSFREPLQDDLKLIDDIGADSLDILQVAVTLQDMYGIHIDADALPSMLTVGGTCDLVQQLIDERRQTGRILHS
ncbi:acyl carrier protein [Burkholderia dolosa]|uniref:Acyl carrier protein n=1 Tax=Burkholderia dolosa TaxID=152500 RepID=A0A892I5Z5_9BURK|nr:MULTISPECIES: acyl carrier protein [Burkholderia]AJY09129.1 phosphopantetheine attachment site family protein [Burkholderia dolosa AU0158]MBR8313157.1 acyl carrier protein [Burkholderia dolosa]MBR8415758.1 acyl carrier protein [Burkholderia dolosa]MBY4659597.1 acyl carrier protein [Burkholderia dolosa]MBY4690681.1 acyl carrier protein [Burkholderia dolosa]